MAELGLWFDVGFKRYTTGGDQGLHTSRCGLMQDSKDIQHKHSCCQMIRSCGLMQDSKDILLLVVFPVFLDSCGLMQDSKNIQLNEYMYNKYKVVV